MTAPATSSKGFISGLFDFSFTSFITLKFLKVIYGLLMGLILLFGLIFLVRGLSEGGGTAFAALVFVPLGTLLYLVFARVWLELIAVIFRIGENTTLLVAQGGPGGGPGSPSAGYGTPPGAPGDGSPYGGPSF